MDMYTSSITDTEPHAPDKIQSDYRLQVGLEQGGRTAADVHGRQAQKNSDRYVRSYLLRR
jgi:hypothetical protein